MNRRSNWGGRPGRGSFKPGWGKGNRNQNSWRGDRNFRGRNDRGGKFNANSGSRQNNWPRRDMPGKRLSEDEIGITEYVSKHAGFTGIIKSRYSDFQVSEIDLDGRIAKLTDLKPPEPPQDQAIEEDEELLLTKYNLEILPMEVWDQINTLATSEPTGTPQKIEIDAAEMSKEQRTKIHDAVKKAFGSVIVSSTVNLEDKKLMKFEKYQKGVRVDNRVKWVWPAEYVYFIVHKENVDTMEAAVRVAEKLHLGIKPSMLGYAGTKDRRAKTSQWFSLRKVDPRKIAAACTYLRDVKVGNFEFRKDNLILGMLKGNRFRIALRNVTACDEVVSAACEELKQKGFINYYGLQRFGTSHETPTHLIGMQLLQGKFKEAIESILAEREGPMCAAMRAFHSSGPSAALRQWPPHCHTNIELRILKALASKPNDLVGALDKLARNTRLLYLHSYQSMIWNRAVSERIRRFGLQPAVGDILPLDTDIKEEIEDEIFEEEEETEESTETESQNGDANKMADENKMPDEKSTEEPQQDLQRLETPSKADKHKIPIKILTQEDIDKGTYTIFDIVMPLPGHVIEYPPNMKEYYEELLVKDGLTLEMKHKIKSYSLSGAYRYIVLRPTDMSWSTVGYTDPYSDLILSDWDELQGVTNVNTTQEMAPEAIRVRVEDKNEEILLELNEHELERAQHEGKYKALLLNMSLPSSCYATMALRELLKRDTSGDSQALQNDYHLKDKTTENTDKADITVQETQSNLSEEKLLQTEKETNKQTNSETCQQLDSNSIEKVEIKEETQELAKESQAEKRKTEMLEESEAKKLKKEVNSE